MTTEPTQPLTDPEPSGCDECYDPGCPGVAAQEAAWEARFEAVDSLTDAERAAARELSRIYNRRDDIPMELIPADFADEARAVVAAVRPILENEGAVKALTAATSDIETLIDAFSNAKGKNLSGAISGLQRALSVVRRRLARLADQSLSRPTSEETHDGR